MERYYGLIELVLVFGALSWFVWSQRRALRKSREADEAAARAAAEDASPAPADRPDTDR